MADLWLQSEHNRTWGVHVNTLAPSTRVSSCVFLLLCLQVTYRVVQVTDDQLDAAADGGGAVSVVSTAAFAGATQAVAQVSKEAAKAADI